MDDYVYAKAVDLHTYEYIYIYTYVYVYIYICVCVTLQLQMFNNIFGLKTSTYANRYGCRFQIKDVYIDMPVDKHT